MRVILHFDMEIEVDSIEDIDSLGKDLAVFSARKFFQW